MYFSFARSVESRMETANKRKRRKRRHARTAEENSASLDFDLSSSSLAFNAAKSYPSRFQVICKSPINPCLKAASQ